MATVDTLQIEISASSEKAASAIDKLTASMTKLQGAFKGTGSKKFENLSKSLRELGETAKGLEDSIGALAKAASAVERLSNIKNVKIPKGIGDGIRNIGQAAEMVTPQAVANLDNMTRSLQRLQNVDLRGLPSALRSTSRTSKATKTQSAAAESGTEEVESQTKGVSSILGRLKERFKIKIETDDLKRVADMAKTALGHLKSLGKKIRVRIEAATVGKLRDSLKGVATIFKALGRIAFYRVIRSAIKAITQAFSEGLKNAYAFSAGLSSAIDGRIAVALDSLSSHALTMKNQLGAAFGSLLTALAPIINALIGLITALATAITQLFAAFTGGTFLKAKYVSSKFADDMQRGGGAAKEWKNQLMGFDEINRLEDQSGGGGGGGGSALNPEDMFDVERVDSAIQDFVNSLKSAIKNGEWSEVGELLGKKVNEIFDRVNWSGIGTKIGYRINGVIQSIYYTLKNIDFKSIGENIATMVNNSLRMINFSIWGALLVRKFTAAIDLFIGFLGRLDWGTIGTKIGDFLRGALDEAGAWLDGYDWATLGKKVTDNIIAFVDGLNPTELAESFKRFVGKAFEKLKEFISGGEWSEALERITSGFSEFLSTLSPVADVIAKVAVALGVVVIAFKAIYDIVTTVNIVFKSLKLAFSVLTSPIAQVVAAILLLVVGFAEIVSGAKKWIETGELSNDAFKHLAIGIGLVSLALAALISPWALVVGAVAIGVLAIIKNWDEIKAKAEDVKKAVVERWEKLKDGVNGVIDSVKGKVDEFKGKFDEAIGPVSDFCASVGSFFSGMWETVAGVIGGIIGGIQSVISWVQSAISWLNGLNSYANRRAQQIQADGSIYLTGFASGGYPDQGQLFIARESGPELVGTANGRTAVANNDDIFEGIRAGVFEAVSAAMGGGNGNSNQPINIYMDGKLIARSTTKYQTQMARANG